MCGASDGGWVRLPGWETRLAEALEAERGRAFELGRHDCWSLALAALAALTGADLWARFAGRYRTPREAMRVMLEHGRDLRELATAILGCEAVPARRARRGDICLFEGGESPAFGVANGAAVAVRGERALLWVRLSACSVAWRIG